MLDCRRKKLATASPILAASLHAYPPRCGRPTCRWHHGGPLHRGQHRTCKGPGLLCFPPRHCAPCRVPRHGNHTLYVHQVLEAKLLGAASVVVSLGSEFIENADAGDLRGKSAEEVKQDCALKALARLAPRIKQAYPQTPFGLALDSLYAWGPVFALAEQLQWSVGATFKEGRPPAGRPVWKLFGSLKNVARRLLDRLRYLACEAGWLDARVAASQRLGLNSS